MFGPDIKLAHEVTLSTIAIQTGYTKVESEEQGVEFLDFQPGYRLSWSVDLSYITRATDPENGIRPPHIRYPDGEIKPLENAAVIIPRGRKGVSIVLAELEQPLDQLRVIKLKDRWALPYQVPREDSAGAFSKAWGKAHRNMSCQLFLQMTRKS